MAIGNASDLDPAIREIENDLAALGDSDLVNLARDLCRVVVPWDANDRSRGIGGSDIWTVVHDPMKAYCEKRGITAREEDADLTEAGRFLEPAIAAWFAARTGYCLRGDGRLVVRHATEPWIFASPDRFVYEIPAQQLVAGWKARRAERLLGGLEIKNVSTWRADAWGGPEPETYDLPEPYYYQIQWCMGVTGLRRWWVAPLIGGNRPRFDHVVDFDEHFFADLVSIARVFWLRHVVPGVAPAVNGSESSAAYLRCRYPLPTREALPPAPPEALVLADSYLELGELIAPLEVRREERKQQLQQMIGESGAPGLELEPGWSVTWRPNKKGSRQFNLRRKS